MKSEIKYEKQGATQDADSMQRVVRPCRCDFQSKSDWGYILREWIGQPKYWRNYAKGRRFSLIEVERRARKFKHVLISCGGCGADIVREYGPNADLRQDADSAAPNVK